MSKKIIAGFGIKVETDTGHMVWLTGTGTTTHRDRAIRFDSQAGADMYISMLSRENPHVKLEAKKFSK